MSWLIRVLSVTIAVSLPLQTTSHSAVMEFQAGVATVSLQPPQGISLAGYGNGARRYWFGEQNQFAHYFIASKGRQDEIRSKVIVCQFDKTKLAFVSIDLLVPSAAMHRELARRLVDIGFDESSIILSATHTHSGPSSYIDNTILEFSALDRYVPEVWQHLTNVVEQSIREADSRLAPARLAIGTRSIHGVTSNRRHKRAVDSLLTIIRVDHVDGTPLATALNFPIHATMMGPRNLWLSADLPGAIERAFEALSGSPAIFLNGAEGDVSPIGPRGEFRLVDHLGGRIAGEAFAFWKSLSPSLPKSFKKRLGQVDLGQASLNILPCLRLDKGSGTWTPALSGWPSGTRLTGVSIDRHAFIAVPGEPTASIGDALRIHGSRVGFTTTSILGLSNDYVGYILSKDEYLNGGYESCASFYGPSLGEKVQDAGARVLEELATH